MLQSMTGFGSAQAEIEGASGPVGVRVEVRAVNHRFLQVKVRLPGDLAPLEGQVEERVKKKLSRGAVSVAVTLSRATAFQDLTLNREVAERWVKLLTKTAKDLSLDGHPSIDMLVGLPGVLGGELDASQQKKGSRAVLKVVDEAVLALIEMRRAEGEALTAEFERLGAEIGRIRARIEKRMPAVIKRHHKTLHERLQSLLESNDGGRRLDPADLAREVALIADRLDVTEEITRLASHGTQLEKLLAKGGAVGRKLDFLVQEFHREANTIGSKASDADVAHLVVDLKASIERLREQVQNIE